MNIVFHYIGASFQGKWGLPLSPNFKAFCKQHKDSIHCFILAYINRRDTVYGKAAKHALSFFDVIHEFPLAGNVSYPDRNIAVEGNQLIVCKLKKEFCE